MLKRVFLILLLTFSLSACLVSPEDVVNGDCPFDINTIVNGAAPGTQTNFWQCINSQNVQFNFLLFANDTGVDSRVGDFIWQEVGCAIIDYTFNVGGTGTASNLELSGDGQVLTFTSNLNGVITSTTCNLIAI